MSTWISRPGDGVALQWHLVVPDPTLPAGFALTACGRTLVDDDADPLDRRDDPDLMPTVKRCVACQAAYLRRVNRPPTDP
jgi:hypothetical protein